MGGNFLADAPGSAPDARTYFLLLRQKKVAKEKATPGYAVGFADSPALLDGPGGCGTRGCAPQTVLADDPRPFCVARRFTWGPGKSSRPDRSAPPTACCGRRRKRAIFARRPQHPVRFSGPLGRCRATQGFADKGRALSEGLQPRVAQPPPKASSAGNRRSRHRPRVAFFFACFLLGDARRK